MSRNSDAAGDAAKSVGTLVTRAYASFSPSWQRFNLLHQVKTGIPSSSAMPVAGQPNSNYQHPYNRQYSHTYARRLAGLRDRCMSSANRYSKEDCNNEEPVVVSRIIELQEGVRSVIVGTFVKESPARPSIDDEPIREDYPSMMEEKGPLRIFCDSFSDSLVLEDESGRVEIELPLRGAEDTLYDDDIHFNSVATGVVAAVTGTVSPDNGGVMTVDKVHFPEFPPHRSPPCASQSSAHKTSKKTLLHSEEKKDADCVDDIVFRNALDGMCNPIPNSGPCIVLVSGLNCGGEGDKIDPSLSLKTDLLVDYIVGNFHSAEHISLRIARVIFAGGSVGRSCTAPFLRRSTDGTNAGVGSSKAHISIGGDSNKKGVLANNSRNASNRAAELAVFPVRELDLVLNNIVKENVPVDIVPGRHDPTNATWPQQALHKCLLPNSGSHFDGALLKRSPNPYDAWIGDKHFLGTDGRNVSDLRRFIANGPNDASKAGSHTANTNVVNEKVSGHKLDVIPLTSIEVLEKTLRFGQMVPTSPDSISGFPFIESDPFIIKSCPHVYFAGNCPRFETKTTRSPQGMEECRLICVPSFAMTGEVVVVDLQTLEAGTVCFNDLELL